MSNVDINVAPVGFCSADVKDLSDYVVAMGSIPSWCYFIVMMLVAMFLFLNNFIFAIEMYIRKANTTVCQQNVLPEEIPDYNLGMDTKYYTYVYANNDPVNPPVQPQGGTKTKKTMKGKTTENADVFDEEGEQEKIRRKKKDDRQ